MSQLSSFGNGGGGGGIITIDGDVGSVTGSTISLKGDGAAGAGSSISFDGSGAAMSFLTTDANNNVIIGLGSGNGAITGTSNTVLGQGSGAAYTSGSQNVAVGAQVLIADTTGSNNIGIGYQTLLNFTASGMGGSNTVIGPAAGGNYTGAEFGNIVIASDGVAAENNTIHIADRGAYQASTCFIGGIDSVNVGSVATVVTESGNQLGTAVLTQGSGITITPGPNTITISASGGGGGISTLTGDVGSATGSNVSLKAETAFSGQGCGSSVLFSGSGAAMTFNVTDSANNVLIGAACGNNSLSGSTNTGLGVSTLSALTTGRGNVGIGVSALSVVANGSNNIGIGASAMSGISNGTDNIGLGSNSGVNYTSNESENVIINSFGVTGDQNTLRIGAGTGSGTQQLTQAFISGIQTVGVTGAAVLVSGADQLGVAVSSRKYKENIEDLGSGSKNIFNLRPVSFNYSIGNDKTIQSGLIAEEVHDVMPSLVVYDKSGDPQTVKYHDLPVLLLNEIQKLRKEVDELKRNHNGK